MPKTPATGLTADIVRTSARMHEPDRYLAALLAARVTRDDLISLAAFTGEINRIPLLVSEPHLAEIRLQWWRDAVPAHPGEKTGNPAADAFMDAIQRHRLPREEIEAWFDALADTFYPAAPDSEAALKTELGLTEGTPFLFAARIAGEPVTPQVQHLARQAGIAYGLARLGLGLAHSLARGRLPLPVSDQTGIAPDGTLDAVRVRAYIGNKARAALGEIRPQFAQSSPALRAALLPVALVEPYLRALESQGHDLQRDIGTIPPVTRVWRLWRAHVSRRI